MTVRAMTRGPRRTTVPASPWAADVHDADSLTDALKGVDVAIYLVHSLDDPEFERKDAEAARTFGRVAAEAGVSQIVYMGGSAPTARTSPRTCVRAARSRACSARRESPSPCCGPRSSSARAASRGS
jgi:uncharacterized protein YbjT (DUF2867 family)